VPCADHACREAGRRCQASLKQLADRTWFYTSPGLSSPSESKFGQELQEKWCGTSHRGGLSRRLNPRADAHVKHIRRLLPMRAIGSKCIERGRCQLGSNVKGQLFVSFGVERLEALVHRRDLICQLKPHRRFVLAAGTRAIVLEWRQVRHLQHNLPGISDHAAMMCNPTAAIPLGACLCVRACIMAVHVQS